MRIEQLAYLIDIAQTQSISKTAHNFYITQQGVSDALKKMEKEFDLELLQRTKYGVVLTNIGQVFAEKGKEILALHQDLTEYAENIHNSKLITLEGELFVFAHPRIYQHILPSVIQIFLDHCPNVHLRVLERPSNETLEAVAQKQAQIGLITISENSNHSIMLTDLPLDGLQAETLFADEMVVCVHKDSPLKFQSILTEEDLIHLPVVTYDFHAVTFRGVDVALQNKVFISNDAETHRQLVRQGLAVDVMTRFEYQRIFGDDPQFIPIPYPKKSKILSLLITSPEVPLSPQSEHFIKLLKNFNYAQK